MPFIVYIFALSAFALGLAEFVPIGLTDVIATGLGVDVGTAGGAVTWYALGATFAAPVLTALTAGWTRRRVMLATGLVFSAGSLVAALSPDATVMLGARFVAGLGHGLFLAVASSTAARMVGPARAGSAVAVIFGGFTLALALGVPIGTWVGSTFAWRPVMGAIALFGMVGWLGLLLGMKEPPAGADARAAAAVGPALRSLLNPMLLCAALVTVLGYAGSFTAFTYIAPLLTGVTGVDASTVGLFMLAYGLFAAIGNLLGGKLTDRHGTGQAGIVVLSGIAATSLGLWALAGSVVAMGVLVALLGLFSYAAVPALQARLILVAERRAPHAHGVAAGLNIAGFNSGIALGSALGGLTIGVAGLPYLGLAGAAMAGLALALLWVQAAGDAAARTSTC